MDVRMENSASATMHSTVRQATINPHSSATAAKAKSESAANTFFSRPLPAPRPNRPPDARHMMARVC